MSTKAPIQTGTEPNRNTLAYLMFIEGYKMRVADDSDAIEFNDPDSLDEHLYRRFQQIYSDSVI